MFDRIIKIISDTHQKQKQVVTEKLAQAKNVDLVKEIRFCEAEAKTACGDLINHTALQGELETKEALTASAALAKIRAINASVQVVLKQQKALLSGNKLAIQIKVYQYARSTFDLTFEFSQDDMAYCYQIAEKTYHAMQGKEKEADFTLNQTFEEIQEIAKDYLKLANAIKFIEAAKKTIEKKLAVLSDSTGQNLTLPKVYTLDELSEMVSDDKKAKKAHRLLTSQKSKVKKAIDDTKLYYAWCVLDHYNQLHDVREKQGITLESDDISIVSAGINKIIGYCSQWLKPLLTVDGVQEVDEALKKENEAGYRKKGRQKTVDYITNVLNQIEENIKTLKSTLPTEDQQILDQLIKTKEKRSSWARFVDVMAGLSSPKKKAGSKSAPTSPSAGPMTTPYSPSGSSLDSPPSLTPVLTASSSFKVVGELKRSNKATASRSAGSTPMKPSSPSYEGLGAISEDLSLDQSLVRDISVPVSSPPVTFSIPAGRGQGLPRRSL